MTTRRQAVPGPRGNLLLGNLLDVRRDRLALVTGLQRRYGDLVRFRMGPRELYLVSLPEGIGHVLQDNHGNYRKGVGLDEARRWLGDGLVTSEGARWARQRRLVQPAFRGDQLRHLAAVVVETTSESLDRWRAAADRDEKVDIAAELMRLTLSVLTRTMFRLDLRDEGEVGAAFTAALRDAMDRMSALVALPYWLPLPSHLRFRRARRTLDEIVERILRHHRKAGGEPGDLLSRLTSGGATGAPRPGHREIRDQVTTLLLAGHETTALSIAWALHLLDRHPWAGERLRLEADRVLGDRLPGAEDLAGLVWTRRVLEESLRLYPPVWLIPRRAVAPDEIGGYPIPAGADVLVSPYVVHRHAGHWDRPEEFDPDRFGRAPPGRFAYLPFGAGPRSCVGRAFASVEATLVLAMIARRFRLRLAPRARVVPEPLLTLRFRHGLWMTPSPT